MAPRPTEIKLHKQSRLLEVAFDDGRRFELPCEYLRVYSPSAEVRGHGPGQEVLIPGFFWISTVASRLATSPFWRAAASFVASSALALAMSAFALFSNAI